MTVSTLVIGRLHSHRLQFVVVVVVSLSPLSVCTGATQLYDVLQGYWKYPLYIKIQMEKCVKLKDSGEQLIQFQRV